MCIKFKKTSSESHCFCLKPTTQVTLLLWQSAHFFQLYDWMWILFLKTSPGSPCFCLKPTTHWTFTVRILCSIVCFNVYKVLKNFFRKQLLLIEAHQSVYIQRAHTWSIVCLNVSIVLKNFLCEPLLLLESQQSLYYHRAHILFNCMFECE